MTSRALAGMLILSILSSPVAASDVKPPIRDGAKLFSPEAIARANDQLLELRQLVDIDVVLETTDTLPPDVIERLGRPGNPTKVFADVAEERAQTESIRGIFVYICKTRTPKHQMAAVVVWPEEYLNKFSSRNCEQLRRLFASELYKHPDETLQKAVDRVREKVKTRAADAESDSFWSGWGMWAAIVGGLVGVWLLLGLIRMGIAADRSGIVGTATEPAHRARFVPGLLGGMFGSVAGHWLYDRLFHAPAKPKPAPDEPLSRQNPRELP